MKSMVEIETSLPRRFSPGTSSVLVLPPFIAAWAAYSALQTQGFAWPEAVTFLLLYLATGISITAGYHRYYAHRSYDCARGVQLFYLIFGAAAYQHTVIRWASDHRYHHRYVDQNADPYNITRGFFWAHMGWIFFDNPTQPRPYANVTDLKTDPLVAWQDRWYVPIALLAGFGVPALIGWATGRLWPCIAWGALVRLVVVHHGTFLINSAAHQWGSQEHDKTSSARDNRWLAFFTLGEGYHNYHHAFPGDYRNGSRLLDFDPAKWLIRGLKTLGWAWNLRTPRS